MLAVVPTVAAVWAVSRTAASVHRGTATPASVTLEGLAATAAAGAAAVLLRRRHGSSASRWRSTRRLLAAAFTVAEPDDATLVSITHAPPMPVRRLVRRFWPYTRSRRAWLAVSLGLNVVTPALEAAQIWLFKLVIDDVLVPKRFDRFPKIALMYVVLLAATAAVNFADDVLSTWLSERFLVDLRTDVFRHLQRLSLDFFDNRRLGDLVSRLTGDVSSIEDFLVSGVRDLFSYGIRLIVFVVALFALQWELALVSLVTAPVFWVTATGFSRRIKAASRERRRRSGSISAVAEETLGNTALVQAYNRQEWEIDRFRRENEAKYRAEMTAARLSAVFSPIVDAIEVFGSLVVLGVGAWEMSRTSLTLGGLLVFVTFLERLYSPLRGLTRLATKAYSASAGAERVVELLEEEPRVIVRPGAWKPEPAPAPGGVRGDVVFDDVTFTYPGTTVPAIEHVSFAVHPGELVALVGPSGAGKSTLAKLMLRFYDPDEGAVTMDGHDLHDIDVTGLRDNVAVVLQETLVFDGSIADNISYGRPGASIDEIIEAARAADAHGFISALPDGYATKVGQRGRRLSGGQRQRLAIARAMLRDAPVLILDEPMTGLDAESGNRILEPLRRLVAGRSTIVISHDLVTVRDATEIVALEHGRLVERGRHEDLLRANGTYARLYRLAGRDHGDSRPPLRALPGGTTARGTRPRGTVA